MSTPVTNPASHTKPAAETARAQSARIRTPLPDDGTRPLLQGAFWTLLVGILAALATRFLFGGIGIHGPHTNARLALAHRRHDVPALRLHAARCSAAPNTSATAASPAKTR